MKKVEVICDGVLYMADRAYVKGDVLEMEDVHAAASVKDKAVKYAAADAAVSTGLERTFDRLDVAIQKRDFEAAKDIAASEGIATPDPALDPKKPAPAATLPENQVAKIGDFQPPAGKK